ncbi:uncharacterized protein LOC129584560 [Paramacrobiotus metropolitanus]|uniref:uncharacterized protein LOC129584560 n=1 Tax=Paramacrobiotus metropolitanus TaxID=2943436 RepID=UPI002445CE44|nr:uncharacterized protein LOC129584560 [Paramacrobiotus metropolitanus]
MGLPCQRSSSHFAFVIFLFISITNVFAGDDGVWPEYPSFPSFRSMANMFSQPLATYRNSAMRRNGRIVNAGPQPPFVLYGAHPLPPACAESPSLSYCAVDQEYPSELITSCLLENVDLFKQLRSKVQWSCEEFPDELLFSKEPSTYMTTTDAAPDAENPAEPETSQPIRSRNIVPKPRSTQERLMQSGKTSSFSQRRVDQRRGKRDDSSGDPYGYSRLMFPMSKFNYTYEVCPSVVKAAVGIVKARTENREWMPLVQMGDCKQIVRMEECLRPDEPCEHLCSNLKSYCQQRFYIQQLLTCTPARGLHLEWFEIPASCGCQVELGMATSATTPDPNNDR